MLDPDMAFTDHEWHYGYDAVGNLTSQTDAKGQTIGFQYDALNRLTRKDYPSGDDVYVKYDDFQGMGLAKNSFGRPRVTFVGPADDVEQSENRRWSSYDDRGRLVKDQLRLDGTTYSVQYGYDALDRVATTTYPDGEAVTAEYNSQGLPVALKNQSSFYYVDANGARYTALGQPRLVPLGGATLQLRLRYDYYPDDARLERIQVGIPTDQDRDLFLEYEYDDVGNVSHITDVQGTSSLSQTYTYDALDRLTSVQATGQGMGGPYGESYGYDEIGNLLSKGSAVYDYPDAGQQRPPAVTSTSAGGAFEYDDNGNMTVRTENGVTYAQAWDYENRLSSVTVNGQTTTFTYDGNGTLVKKATNSNPPDVTVYVGNVYETKPLQTGSVTKYYYFNGQRIAMKASAVLYWLAGDHLGSTTIALNALGGKVADTRNLPYGQERWHSGTLPTDYRWTGQRLSAELGLYQMGARWVDPSLSRWLSPDAIDPDRANPQSNNRYSYVLGNPLRYNDPTGHKEAGECDQDDNGCAGEPPPETIDLSQYWDPSWLDSLSEQDRLAAEQAFLLLLSDPAHFVELYLNPEAWGASPQIASLEVFAEYSILHTSAESLLLTGFTPDIASALYSERMSYHREAESGGSDQSIIGPTVAVVGSVNVTALIAAAKRAYPGKANLPDQWHHITPIYLGGPISGPQVRIPAAYHQWITNEFRRLWAYGQMPPNPQRVQQIIQQVYLGLPIPPNAPRR